MRYTSDQEFGSIPLPLKLSASSMSSFLNCRGKYYLSRFIQPTGGTTSESLQMGLDTHEIMSGEKPIKDASNQFVRAMAGSLQDLCESLHITTVATEITQVFPLDPPYEDILFERRIDALGIDKNGIPIIIDWKTSRNGWGKADKPASMYSLQTVGYFLKPPEYIMNELEEATGWDDPWPTKMMYMVVSRAGQAKPYTITKGEYFPIKDFYNVVEDMLLVTGVPTFLYQNRGYNCGFCDFYKYCYSDTPWTTAYELREKKGIGEENAKP